MKKCEKFTTLSTLPKSHNICYNYKMNFYKKKWFWALLALPMLTMLLKSTPSSSTHIIGDQSLTLPQELTASIIEVGPHYQTDRRFVSDVYNADKSFELLGLNWEEAIPEGTTAAIEIRFQTTEGEWTDWQSLEQDNDHPDGDNELWTYIITEESEAFQYRVFLATEDTSVTPKLSNVTFDAVDGGRNSVLGSLSKLVFNDDNSVKTRKSWGADEDMLLTRYYDSDLSSSGGDVDEEYTESDPDLKIVKTVSTDKDGNPYLWPQEYPKDIKKIIVHHTATSGKITDAEESIRAIYYYHAVTRGWGDIGYNYIIAPDGTVYQGRAGDEGVVAGHASGYNTGTIGIALLGNYEESTLPSEVMQSLTGLIYEKAELHDIDIDGTGKYRGKTMDNLLGHRDVDSTACPGQYAYTYLEDIKKIVGAAQDEDKSSSSSYSYEDYEDREMITVDSGKNVTVTIKIKNTGSKTWDSSTYLVVNADDEADDVISIPKDSSKRTATMKESSVAPGKTATFTFTATSTKEPGLVHFEAAPVFNGSEKSKQYMDLAFFVEGKKSSSSGSSTSGSGSSSTNTSNTKNKDVIIATYDDLTFEPGEKKYAWVQVKNTSSSDTWNSSGSKAFSLAFTNPQGVSTGTPKVTFQSLKPGSVGKVYFTISAPTVAGEYDISIRPRVGNSNVTSKAYTLTITVSEETFEAPEYENPIRIKLTPDNAVGSPELTSDETFALYDDDELVKVFDGGDTVKVVPGSSKYTVSAGSEKWTMSGPVRFTPEKEDGIMEVTTMDQPNWNDTINYNEFRGTMEIQKVDGSAVLINELSLEDYVMGMAEEPNDTPEEKLKTMAILARTYAYYYLTQAEKFPGKPYDGEDDPATFQKYLGANYELSNVVEAAKDTEGIIVTYKGTVVKTPYFSSSDGTKTKSAKDVWGWTNTPWLVSVSDKYCKGTSFAGHGVGLSGCGAKALAEQGWTFEQIIKYYYTGVELGTL